MDVLLLRLDAPLMSFGGTVVDQINTTRDFPGRAMLAGLLGNALGYDHREADRLDALQSRMRWAAREDQPGRPFLDYQTVNLASEHMAIPGWTTWGTVDRRESNAKITTAIRYRHYLADAVYVVAVSLLPGDGPDVDALDRAVQRPARPLFLGRKCCLPSTPLRYGRVETDRLRDALVHPSVPRIVRHGLRRGEEAPTPRVRAWWPVDEGTEVGRTLAFTDDMDWVNQLHVGRRYVQEAFVEVPAARAAQERAS